MTVISLLTDFGVRDEYLGVMKGAVLKENPHVTLVDLCHHIPPFDTLSAARMLAGSFSFFPDGTIHVVVVDPGVGSARRIVAFEMEKHYFIAPDNGIPSFLIQNRTPGQMVSLDFVKHEQHAVSTTFHGRDMFAPAAARLAAGRPLTGLGQSLDPASLKPPDCSRPRVDQAGRCVTGTVVSVDRFGNLITDMDRSVLNDVLGEENKAAWTARLGTHTVKSLSNHYGEVAVSSPLMVFGSRDYLELSVNQGSAAKHFNAGRGDTVHMSLEGKGPDEAGRS